MPSSGPRSLAWRRPTKGKADMSNPRAAHASRGATRVCTPEWRRFCKPRPLHRRTLSRPLPPPRPLATCAFTPSLRRPPPPSPTASASRHPVPRLRCMWAPVPGIAGQGTAAAARSAFNWRISSRNRCKDCSSSSCVAATREDWRGQTIDARRHRAHSDRWPKPIPHTNIQRGSAVKPQMCGASMRAA